MANKEAYNVNDAIVEKVRSILNNTDCISGMCIMIDGSAGETPTIRYNIKELIVPKKEATDGKDSEV